MKIFQIDLNYTSDIIEKKISKDIFSLYIFKTPVIFTINGNDTAVSGSFAIITSSDINIKFRSPSQKKIKFDCIRFCPSATDKQYMTSINLPLNTPVRIKEEFTVFSSVRAMKINYVCHGKHVCDLMELYIKIILISISESYMNSSEKNEIFISRYSELKNLRNSVYEEPSAPWNIEDICIKMDISRTYFHRLYKEAFGVTFLRDVIESRLLLGAELLTSTNLSISAVAEKCGYENDSYFMRQFKKYRGCTPSEYRKRAANNM